jgi:hypothetical protein
LWTFFGRIGDIFHQKNTSSYLLQIGIMKKNLMSRMKQS